MNRRAVVLTVCALLSAVLVSAGGKSKPPAELSPLDKYIQEAAAAAQQDSRSEGSIYRDDGLLSDLGRDLRARNVNDLVTIVVSERASAVSTGNSKTSRKSSAEANVEAFYGLTKPGGPWPNLLKMGSESSLDGQGATARQTSISTNLSARVTHVLPNGYLVVEGSKEVQVNSERQLVTIRGVVRWNDISRANTVRSDSLAQMEVRINGKGIVGDAVRRPNFLVRLLLGIIPF
jgi:flagellar L-ring protein precursor FlgH